MGKNRVLYLVFSHVIKHDVCTFNVHVTHTVSSQSWLAWLNIGEPESSLWALAEF